MVLVLNCLVAGSSPLTRGKLFTSDINYVTLGSSPLTLGKHAARVDGRVKHGLIPAHAGKTRPDR